MIITSRALRRGRITNKHVALSRDNCVLAYVTRMCPATAQSPTGIWCSMYNTCVFVYVPTLNRAAQFSALANAPAHNETEPYTFSNTVVVWRFGLCTIYLRLFPFLRDASSCTCVCECSRLCAIECMGTYRYMCVFFPSTRFVRTSHYAYAQMLVSSVREMFYQRDRDHGRSSRTLPTYIRTDTTHTYSGDAILQTK